MSRKLLKYFGIIIGVLIFVLVFFYFKYRAPAQIEWGLTYSYQEAKGLGFDGRQMYLDILADLKPKKIRLMSYWEDTEKSQGQFDFSNIDWQLQQAAKYNTDVVLVVGRKQPRWPECHQPDWYNQLSSAGQDNAVVNMIKANIEHFKSFSVIKAWQVENEPYFGFGPDCPKSSQSFFEKEVALVKRLDSRSIVVTDSGERGSWLPVARSGANILGSSVYRVSYDSKYGGYYKYPVPAIFYKIKQGFLETFTNINQVWDVELQMEPWFTNGALNTPLDTQKMLMNQKVFADNIGYAKRAGFGENYLWGVEWWYWMAKKNGDFGMWTAAKDLFAGK